MKHTLKFILLICITALLASCKLAVIVVEGGEVQSTGSGTCIAGTVCIVEVTDTSFSETFTAVPNDGWYFKKWNSGGDFWCPDLTSPTCPVSSEVASGIPWAEALIASSETFYLMPVFELIADCPLPDEDGWNSCVQANGKQWLQPSLFFSSTWNDVNSVCPPPSGVCTGTLGSIDVTGYTWASLADMDALMASYGMVINPEKNSTWGPLFRSDFRGGRVTPEATVRYFWGYTSGQVRIVGVEENTDPREFDKYEQNPLGAAPNPDSTQPLVGVWLWRTP